MIETTYWLIIALALVGAASIVALIVILFSSIGKRPLRLWSTEVSEIGTDKFFRTIAMTCGGWVGAQRENFVLLNEYDNYFDSIFDSLDKAQKTINFMNFICVEGKLSDRLFNILVAKAKGGVEVRLLLDGFGSLGSPKDRIEELRQAGGKVSFFRPLKFGKFTQALRRNHRRAITIDGAVGYIGGAAFADRWMGEKGKLPFRESMTRVTGSATQQVQAAFTQVWADTEGELLAGEEFYPEFRGNTRYDSVENPIRFVSVISSPSMEIHPLSRFFWLSLAAAKKSIYITNPYFVPPRHIVRILSKKAKAGLDVRILLPSRRIDRAVVRPATHKFYKTLLSAGVRIYEYQPAVLHAKHLVIDGTWSVVGSSNLDIRSLYINKENVMGVYDLAFANELEKAFMKDIESSKEIGLKHWSRRSAWKRLKERAASLFEEQL